MKKTFAVILFSILTPLVSAEVNVTSTLISDYVFSGISQTDSKPAIQIGLNYAHESGFFAGSWGSTVDFNDDADLEIDYYAGYYSKINQEIAYDVSFSYYTYTGYSSENDADYGEIKVKLYLESFSAALSYAPDYFNSGYSAQYFTSAYDLQLPEEYALTLQAGYSFGDAFKDIEYIDYSATLAKTFNDFDVTAAVINTDIDNKDDNADLRFVLGVSYSF